MQVYSWENQLHSSTNGGFSSTPYLISGWYPYPYKQQGALRNRKVWRSASLLERWFLQQKAGILKRKLGNPSVNHRFSIANFAYQRVPMQGSHSWQSPTRRFLARDNQSDKNGDRSGDTWWPVCRDWMLKRLPSGEHTKSYWKWPFIVDFPIKNGDFPLLC